MTGNPPIDCDDVLRNLFGYLDGEVDENLHRAIGAHLERCRACFSRAEFETRLREHLRELGREALPPDVERRLNGMLESLPER